MDFLSVFGAFDFAIRDALTLTLVALSIHVLLAAGVFAVPQVGLMAVGAYTAATLAVDLKVPFPVTLLCGAATGAVLAAGLAGLLARLTGIYLAIASIAFSEVVRVAVLNVPALGGASGIVGVPRSANDLWLCGVVVAAVTVLWWMERSQLGAAMRALRADALMAAHQGIDVGRTRVWLFAVSGALASCAGALQVHTSGYVEPGQFDFSLLTKLLAVVVIGGMAYIGGSFLGAAFVFGLPFALDALAELQVLVNGILIAITVAFVPGGLWGLFARRHRAPEASRERAESVGTQILDKVSEPGEPVLDLRGAGMAFGGVQALDGVDLTVHAGEVLGIIGPNGSGKTTLLNVLSGVYRPTAGTGIVNGSALRPLFGHPHLIAAAGVARTFQAIRLMDDATATVNVELGVLVKDAAERRRITADLLGALHLELVAGRLVGDLSYGLRRRIEIARALARGPRLLLLDEPTAGMNPAERAEVFETIAAARAAGIAVVVVEHDLAMMRSVCDRLLVLDFGRPIAEGEPEKVLSSKEVLHAYVGTGARA